MNTVRYSSRRWLAPSAWMGAGVLLILLGASCHEGRRPPVGGVRHYRLHLDARDERGAPVDGVTVMLRYHAYRVWADPTVRKGPGQLQGKVRRRYRRTGGNDILVIEHATTGAQQAASDQSE